MKHRSSHFTLQVDPILCDGFGHCHELAPELVTTDEWGYPIIETRRTALSDVAKLASARLAVRGCPRQALRIERHSQPTQ